MLTKDQIDFVKNLELPPRDMVHVGREATVLFGPMFDASAATTDGVITANPAKPSGFVDDGSLVTFVAGISAQNQADVLNSTLLAQLAANKKFDREKNTVNWYAFYRNVLENVGWVVQAFQFEKQDIGGASATVDKFVVDMLVSIAADNEMEAVTLAMKALKNLPAKDNRIVLFDHSTHSDSNGNFQIAACSENGGQVAMKIGAFYFSSSKNVDRLLWYDFSASHTSIYKAVQAMTLNQEVFGQVRDAVKTKLGGNARNFVADLDI